MLRFVIATKADFETAGIPITGERTTIDGRYVKHIELLSDEQFDTDKIDEKFEFKSDLTGLLPDDVSTQ